MHPSGHRVRDVHTIEYDINDQNDINVTFLSAPFCKRRSWCFGTYRSMKGRWNANLQRRPWLSRPCRRRAIAAAAVLMLWADPVLPVDSQSFANTSPPYALSALSPPTGLDPAKVALGKRLFHDPILSGAGGLSCSSCHDLSTGGTIRVPRSIGYDGRVHAFNVPTIFNVGNNYRLG